MKTFCNTNSLQFALLGILLLTSAAQAAVTPVHLITENAVLSAREDGANVDATLQIKNDGMTPARNVRVDSVTLRGGMVQALDLLPQVLGDLEPEANAVLNLRLTVPRLYGTYYLLTINGRYTYAGQDYNFSLNRYLEPGRTPAGRVSTRDGITVSTYDGVGVIQHPDATGHPPPPPSMPEEPNAETQDLTPGPLHQSFAPALTPPDGEVANSADVQMQVDVNARQLKYLFAFNAEINDAVKRLRPYVRIETLTLNPRASTAPPGLDIYVPLAEYDVWHPDAYALAALETFRNVSFPSIDIALAAGDSAIDYPRFPVGFKDDFVVHQPTNSNLTQVSRFGDYLHTRSISSTLPFSTEVHDVLQNVPGSNCATGSCRKVMRFVQFGRPTVVIGLR